MSVKSDGFRRRYSLVVDGPPASLGFVHEMSTAVVCREKIKIPKLEFQCQKVIGNGLMSGTAPGLLVFGVHQK
jgi:hypothetical protein